MRDVGRGSWQLALIIVCGFAVGALAAEKPNVLLLCIDDLRPELNCFGKSYVKSPNIDRLAAEGRAFHRHFVNAPTCGASRYTLLTGRYSPGSNNHALFMRANAIRKDAESVPPSMPAWLRSHGYTTTSIGKVSHHPGGWGGKDWNNLEELEMPLSWDRTLMPSGAWQHPRGIMHGLANGEIRKNAKDMDLFQTVAGPDEIYPDGLITEAALTQLETLSADKEKPFFLAVGFIRPHLPFGAPAEYLTHYKDVELPPTPHPEKPEGKTTWHGSGEFMKYNRWGKNPNTDAEFAMEVRRHYAACVTYADAQVGRVLRKLEELDELDKTIIILWGDHGWHLGEHAIWGKHALFEESLHSPLIIRYPGMADPGKKTDAVVESCDLFPTLCDLAELPKPSFVHGSSLLPQLQDPTAKGRVAVAYRGGARTIRTATHRLIAHDKGAVELYDHQSAAGETANVAGEHPELVSQLKALLDERLGQK